MERLTKHSERKYYICGSEKSADATQQQQICKQIEKYGVPDKLHVDIPTQISKNDSAKQ